MLALLERPTPRGRWDDRKEKEKDAADLEGLISAMGKRLQGEYIEGAIPYLRKHEPELWAKLEVLDREQSIEALLEYERLFFDGLHRYITFMDGKRKAA
ncbi:MAG: hypothetical protein NTW68_05700 [candidate division NC10 bacterium]|nr:hypothetical protein [candidate division NC10 bacterium]